MNCYAVTFFKLLHILSYCCDHSRILMSKWMWWRKKRISSFIDLYICSAGCGYFVLYQNFIIARAVMSESTLAEALMIPQQSVAVKVKNRNIMSVNVPVFDFRKEEGSGDIYPYGTAFTSGELDSAMNSFSDAMEPLLRLAESEKTAQLLAQEIERTRRRVNALENVMIPNYQETIKFIAMKLEENERGATTRLMKVKDMMLQEAHGYERM